MGAMENTYWRGYLFQEWYLFFFETEQKVDVVGKADFAMAKKLYPLLVMMKLLKELLVMYSRRRLARIDGRLVY